MLCKLIGRVESWKISLEEGYKWRTVRVVGTTEVVGG